MDDLQKAFTTGSVNDEKENLKAATKAEEDSLRKATTTVHRGLAGLLLVAVPYFRTTARSPDSIYSDLPLLFNFRSFFSFSNYQHIDK
jgi:hypothetical protein